MYTSGWPKIQNRCCQSSGSAPAPIVVEVRAEEAVELEEHQRDRDHREGQHEQELHDERIHVNIGMRIRFIPGARMLMIVVMKLNAAASD